MSDNYIVCRDGDTVPVEQHPHTLEGIISAVARAAHFSLLGPPCSVTGPNGVIGRWAKGKREGRGLPLTMATVPTWAPGHALQLANSERAARRTAAAAREATAGTRVIRSRKRGGQ